MRDYFLEVIYWGLVIAFFVYVFSSATLTKEQKLQRREFGLNTYVYLKENCSLREECKKFPEVNEKCSVAGDIDRCIEMNMPFGWDSCDTNGEVKPNVWRFGEQYPSKFVPPTTTQCLINRGGRWIEGLTGLPPSTQR